MKRNNLRCKWFRCKVDKNISHAILQISFAYLQPTVKEFNLISDSLTASKDIFLKDNNKKIK